MLSSHCILVQHFSKMLKALRTINGKNSPVMKTLSDLGSGDKDEANASCYETRHLYGLDN